MSFTDEEFDRLEREIAALFVPAGTHEQPGVKSERINRILDRVQIGDDSSAGGGESFGGGADEPSDEAGG